MGVMTVPFKVGQIWEGKVLDSTHKKYTFLIDYAKGGRVGGVWIPKDGRSPVPERPREEEVVRSWLEERPIGYSEANMEIPEKDVWIL